MPEQLATSISFNLPIDELIQEAIDTLGGENQSGYDALSAIRSLNLLLIDLSNRGYPLGNMEKRTIDLVSGTSEYLVTEDTLSILDMNLKDGTVENQMKNIPFLDYFNISDKTITGRPSQYCFDRTGTQPKIRIYPTPDDATLDIEYWVVRRSKDINKLYQLVDMQHRYLPALTMGLAYFMAFKKPGIDPGFITFLKNEYLERLDNAFGEDVDHFDFVVYPYISRF